MIVEIPDAPSPSGRVEQEGAGDDGPAGSCPGPAEAAAGGEQVADCWVTVPAGRFLLDLPGAARLRFGRQGFNEAGAFIQIQRMADPAVARAAAEARIRALQVPHEEGGTRLARVVAASRGPAWFLYFWKDTAFKDATLELQGYLWREGLLLTCRGTCPARPEAMARRARVLAGLLGGARRRELLEVPRESGFCLRDAYFPGPPGPGSAEHVELLAGAPGPSGWFLRLATDTVGDTIRDYPQLLERTLRATGEIRLRAGDRRLGPFRGQELARRATRAGAPEWRFTWECRGRPGNPLAPMIVLEMRGAGPPAAEGRLLDLWDRILESLRQRETFLRNLRLPAAFRSSWEGDPLRAALTNRL